MRFFKSKLPKIQLKVCQKQYFPWWETFDRVSRQKVEKLPNWWIAVQDNQICLESQQSSNHNETVNLFIFGVMTNLSFLFPEVPPMAGSLLAMIWGLLANKIF